MRSFTTTQAITTQKASPSAQPQQCSIRCTSVPKGHALKFTYQPSRVIAIG
jgi:hypothetical protein